MAADILGVWGPLSLVPGWLFVSRRSGTLLVWSGVGTAVLLLPAIFFAVTIVAGGRSRLTDLTRSPAEAVLRRLVYR